MKRMKNRGKLLVPLLVLMAGLLGFSACEGATTEDIRGLLQAMEGKEMVVTREDGSTLRITVEQQSAAAQAQSLVGDRVTVRVRSRGGERELEQVSRLGEDQHFSGTIESINGDMWTVGGSQFKVDANTRLDGGLAVGVLARVEFVTLADGTALATEIQTDEDDEHFSGAIESMGSSQWVIGGETFQVNNATRLDDGLAIGVVARVEFVRMQDASLLAIEIETDQGDNKFIGAIESKGADSWVIGGRTFQINAATHLSRGGRNLDAGVVVRVEFITISDGTLVATEIQAVLQRFSGTVESIGSDEWVVGGRTFKITGSTRLDDDLAVGKSARVRFVEMADGTMVATRIQDR
ncbi:MAG: DUF5666 domain-containing protein [Dehalococcoidales bacterium]|nr:DUF5666 domain-containing protein [Dehalococcoidales bacterium]